MTQTNDNNSSILTFPNQNMDIPAHQLTDKVLAYQARMRITHFLNEVAQGERVLCQQLRDMVNSYNQTVVKHGYDPIEI